VGWSHVRAGAGVLAGAEGAGGSNRNPRLGHAHRLRRCKADGVPGGLIAKEPATAATVPVVELPHTNPPVRILQCRGEWHPATKTASRTSGDFVYWHFRPEMGKRSTVRNSSSPCD